MLDLSLQIFGGVLAVLALLDIFYTVLFARHGKTILSERLAMRTWRVLRFFARRLPRSAGETVLLLSGPLVLVVMVGSWIALLVVGFALIYWPMLGSSVLMIGGSPTPTDFISALYVSVDSLSTAGNGDFGPQTSASRLVAMINCMTGIVVITLIVTYIVQIYNALQKRNTLALSLHHATAETGNAASWLTGLGPCGNLDDAPAALAQIARDLASVYEGYHFYPTLIYFHFGEVQYAQSRTATIVMDAVSLIHTALDESKYPCLTRSGGVRELELGGMRILNDLSRVYLPGGGPDDHDPLRGDLPDKWRKRYHKAIATLREAGIATVSDVDAGARRYVETRRHWGPRVAAFARYMSNPLEAIDPACGE